MSSLRILLLLNKIVMYSLYSLLIHILFYFIYLHVLKKVYKKLCLVLIFQHITNRGSRFSREQYTTFKIKLKYLKLCAVNSPQSTTTNLLAPTEMFSGSESES